MTDKTETETCNSRHTEVNKWRHTHKFYGNRFIVVYVLACNKQSL